ncbi:MAG: selenium-dependent xanthine dehydrogenase [Phycisphaerales bacterium]|nr:MAG: selenium-dependent xanthine dehydrogenase [Phycisphaerales bacterium]
MNGQIEFTLNDKPVSIHVDERAFLLDVLRDQCGIRSVKNGCQPHGQCGACTVLVDGRPKLSCSLKASKVAGKRVVTCEGLGEELRRQIAACFVQSGAVQCGYCTPGMVTRGIALLVRNPVPTRKEIAKALRSNLCRCTGYAKIIDAVQLLWKVRLGDVSVPRAELSGAVGTSLPRYRGAETVLGDRPFIDDMSEPEMLFGAVRLADHPRALVKGINIRAALAVEGVERVITFRDVPGERYVGLIQQDWPVFVAQGEETRCMGDVMALVVARDRHTAHQAAELIAIDYDIRDPVTDPNEALKPEAPKIHPSGNLLSTSAVARGDASKALAESAHLVDRVFRTQRVEHMYLEPEASLARPDGRGGLKVYSAGQGMFDDRRQIAAILGWPVERVNVELVSNGGAFGGKEDLSVQGHAALAAHVCGRAVKVVLTREQSFRLHPKRHPMELHYRVGCDADGHLTAVQARIIGDTGAYASVGAKVLERACGHAAGPYKVDNVDVEALAVYTNNPPSGAMRGFGVNQVAFALEGCLDELAEKVGIDGWEMRWRNILRLGDRCTTGQRMDKPFGLSKTLLAVKEVYRSAKYAGIACGMKNVGSGNGTADEGKATLTIEQDESVHIRIGHTEMGQGLFTLCVQEAAQETGLGPETFRVSSDTTDELDCGQTTASRGTVLSGHAVVAAARKLRADLDAGKGLSDLVGNVYRGDYAYAETSPLGAEVPDPVTHLTYGFATQVVILDEQGRLQKVVAAHDVGKVMNPLQLEGQIEGAIHMGLGYALTEELVLAGGHVKSDTVNSLNILRAEHMPEVEVIFVEEPDPDCPYGARGVGEIGLVPTAPAVAEAIRKFEGRRYYRLPMRESAPAGAILDARQKRKGK